GDFAKGWKLEEHLDPEVLLEIRETAAAMLGRRWDPDEGRLMWQFPEDEDENIEWVPIIKLTRYFNHPDWNAALEDEVRDSFYVLVDVLHDPERTLEWDEICDDITGLLTYHYPDLVDGE
ncbi:unnamed protein product, partial [marine sediment metagenome]